MFAVPTLTPDVRSSVSTPLGSTTLCAGEVSACCALAGLLCKEGVWCPTPVVSCNHSHGGKTHMKESRRMGRGWRAGVEPEKIYNSDNCFLQDNSWLAPCVHC